MKIKSYYSRSVEDAMAAARAELGPDALLVNSRKASIQTRHLGDYEVVFATLEPGEPEAAPPVQASSPSPAGEASARPAAPAPPTTNYALGDRLSTEVAELKKELEGMRRVLTRSAYSPQQFTGASPDVSDAFGALSAAEVEPELAQEILTAVSARVNPRVSPLRAVQRHDAATFQRALVEEISGRFSVEPVLGRNSGGPRIVALVGPPGSGKTTTLVKLAVTYGLAARRPVMLLSMDTHRVAAAEQLRSYAAILGVGFQVLETVGSLAQTIEENRSKELIFIDTPGLGLGDLEDNASLGHFLSTREDIDSHLVLPASMKPADLTRMVNAFEVLGPKRLLFTKLDETSSFGPIFSEAARTRKPLSFFTAGQRIPEDLEAATRERLLGMILSDGNGKTRAA